MAVRFFDGVDDAITFPAPAVGGAAYTFAALIARTSSSSGLSFFAGRETTANKDAMGFNANKWGVGNDSQIVTNDGTGVTPTDDWVIVVGSIPSGANPLPHLSVYKLNTAAWFHGDANSTFAMPQTATAFRVGYVKGLESFKGSFAIGTAAYWSVALTDVEVESLAASLATQDWADLHPEALEYLADFNQASAATPVVDLSGNGLDQTGIVGTAVGTVPDPPGWTFGVSTGAPSVSGTSAVSGGGSITTTAQKATSASSTTSGGGTIASTGEKASASPSALTGGGSISSTGLKGASGASSVAGSGSIASTGQKRASVASTASGGGTIASTGQKAAQGASSVSGGGSVTTTGGAGATIAFGASSVSGGGSIVSSGSKTASGSSRITARGSIVTTAYKAASGSSAVTGGGSVSTTGTTALPPGTLTLALRPLGLVDLSTRPLAVLELDTRPKARLTIGTRPRALLTISTR